MINSISLKGIQNHSDTALALDKGVNVIIGNSDQGKSAIIRALRLVAFNRPLGDSIIKNGFRSGCVQVCLSGVNVSRCKGAVNEYRLGAEAFKAMGSGVPEKIIEALKLQDINFQSQLDPPFLLSLSAGEVAKQLNKTVDLDIIDRGIGKINSQIRHNKIENDLTIGRVKEAEEELESYNYITDIDTQLIKLEVSWIKLERIQKQIMRTEEIVDQIQILQPELDKHSDYNSLQKELEGVEETQERIKDNKNKHDNLKSVLTKYRHLKEDIRFSNFNLENLITNEQELTSNLKECPLCGK